MAEGPIPVFIVPPPQPRRRPWWLGIWLYIRYLAWGIAILGALRIISWFF